jgi:hypothetical protein
MLLAAFATFAQEEFDVNELEPAVDTSEMPASAAASSATIEDERDALEPAVSSSALAADVTRQQRDGQVMDRLELGRTEITGNQELPKVLYIVPWQNPDPGDLLDRPINSLLDEVLAPVDRDEFLRQVDYYGDLYGDKQE